MIIYSVTFHYNQTLVKAVNIRQAQRWAKNMFGAFDGPYIVERATDEDIAWVTAWNAKIHEAPPVRRRKAAA